MKLGQWHMLYILAALSLAGCFQQAGDTLQSTGYTAVPLNNNAINIPVDNTTEPDSSPGEPAATPTTIIFQQTGPGTPTLPPITIVVQPTIDPSLLAQNTPAPQNEQAQGEQTGIFITPGISLGPDMATVASDPAAAPPSDAEALQPSATPSGLITPTALWENTTSATGTGSQPAAGDACTYTVQAGDNLFRIALNHNTSVDAMRNANDSLSGANPILQPGQVLIIPDCDANGNTTSQQDQTTGGDTLTPTPVPPIMTPSSGPFAPSGMEQELQPEPTATVVEGQVYIVQSGDTLYTIAQRHGVRMADIIAANNLANPDRLSLGQELIIPQGGNG